MQDHHVVWLPGPDEELALIRRILDMLLITPASRVAATLTNEGILSPDAGRYRTPHSDSYKYKCGLYQQSHGQRCAHNTVDGPSATRFMLSNLRQRLPSPMLRARLEQRLRRLAERELSSSKSLPDLTAKRNELSRLTAELETISKNMALAKSPAQYEAVAAVYDDTKGRHAALGVESATAENVADCKIDVEAEISKALGLIGRLTELIGRDGDDPGLAREVFVLTNARLFLRFRPRKVKNRALNKIAGGVVTFGAAPPPIETYAGPTGRSKIKGSTLQRDTEPSGCGSPMQPECVDSGGEGKSLGNVNRGDWI